jgi:hypothetical protein
MKSQKKKLSRYVPMLIGAVVGGFIGFLGAQAGAKAAEQIPGGTMIALAVAFIPVFFFVIAVHEAGHAWTGVQVNFDFRTYIVGPFLWDKQPDGWKFKWNKNINTSGGLVICIPKGSENLAKRFMLFAAGGPLASLALSIISGSIYFIARGPDQSAPVQFLVYTLALIAFLSLAIFLVTSLPFHTGGFSSDGARVLRILRGGNQARFEILMLKIVTSSMAGMRPAQLDRAELDEAQQLGERLQSPMAVYIRYYLYLHALDLSETDAAEQHLMNYISHADEVPEGFRSAVWLEAAFFYAVVRGDLQKAEENFRLYKPSALTPVAVEYATRAAMAQLKNEPEEFKQWLTKAEQALPAMMDRGAMLMVQERIKQLKLKSSMEVIAG